MQVCEMTQPGNSALQPKPEQCSAPQPKWPIVRLEDALFGALVQGAISFKDEDTNEEHERWVKAVKGIKIQNSKFPHEHHP